MKMVDFASKAPQSTSGIEGIPIATLGQSKTKDLFKEFSLLLDQISHDFNAITEKAAATSFSELIGTVQSATPINPKKGVQSEARQDADDRREAPAPEHNTAEADGVVVQQRDQQHVEEQAPSSAEAARPGQASQAGEKVMAPTPLREKLILTQGQKRDGVSHTAESSTQEINPAEEEVQPSTQTVAEIANSSLLGQADGVSNQGKLNLRVAAPGHGTGAKSVAVEAQANWYAGTLQGADSQAEQAVTYDHNDQSTLERFLRGKLELESGVWRTPNESSQSNASTSSPVLPSVALSTLNPIWLRPNVLESTPGDVLPALGKIAELRASASNSSNSGHTSFSSLAGSDRQSPQTEATRSSKQHSARSNLLQNMERVETTLKEVARSNDGKSISLRLDPPELGYVRVDVSIRDGGLHARLSTESSQVGTILREKAHDLQSVLRRLGLDVDRVTVSVNTDQVASDMHNTMLNDRQERSNSEHGAKRGRSGMSSEGEQREVFRRDEASVLDHWIA